MAYPGQRFYPEYYYPRARAVAATPVPQGLNRRDFCGGIHPFAMKNPRYHPDAVLHQSAWPRDLERHHTPINGYILVNAHRPVMRHPFYPPHLNRGARPWEVDQFDPRMVAREAENQGAVIMLRARGPYVPGW